MQFSEGREIQNANVSCYHSETDLIFLSPVPSLVAVAKFHLPLWALFYCPCGPVSQGLSSPSPLLLDVSSLKAGLQSAAIGSHPAELSYTF